MVFRYGGDEFVVLLPGSGQRLAEKVAGRIEASSARKPYGHLVTLSIGVATLQSTDGFLEPPGEGTRVQVRGAHEGQLRSVLLFRELVLVDEVHVGLERLAEQLVPGGGIGVAHRADGGPEPPRGKHPPVLIAPMDGAVLPCPGVQPGWEPEFRFRAPGSGRHFVLHLMSGAQGGPVYPPAPERHLSFRMQVGRNALRTGDEVAYKLSSGDLSENPTADPWQALASSGFIPPLPVMCRVESIDERGESVGLSASARLVLITGPAQ